MKNTSFQQIVLEADEGKYICCREDKVIGKTAYLGRNDTPDRWEEITEDEKNRLEAEWEAESDAEAGK